ncbi:acyltransferase family protein [Pelagibius sp.]|uniref:acyltransferase family protein n=1 Tax=Pelagibius sp. TaxID=1931238 RepID=UPI003B50E298
MGGDEDSDRELPAGAGIDGMSTDGVARDKSTAAHAEIGAWSPATAEPVPRFLVLDSWRGIAACFVAAFHAGPVGHLQDLSLLRQAYYFVDFFFVLSGFVIAANYGSRLFDLASVGRFLLLRVGRLYPLHLAMLTAFVGLELLKFLPGLQALAFQPPFSTPQTAPSTIATNLLLIHSLGIHQFYTWNTPSWSISTEFYTYVVFAVALLLFRARMTWVLIGALLVGPLALAALHGSLGAGYDYGLIRSIYGFAAGAVGWQLYGVIRSRWGSLPLRRVHFSLLEALAVLLVALAIMESTSSQLSLLLPYVFCGAVLLFAFEGGALSSVLKHRAFLLLGVLSYSIYMTHMLVRRLILKTADAVEKHIGLDVVQQADGTRIIGTEFWHGDLYLLSYLLIVIGVSMLTYRLIEQPARAWSRSLVLNRRAAARPSESGA